MGKHSGSSDEEATTPYGSGPHPTEEQSEQAGKDFDDQWKSSGGRD